MTDLLTRLESGSGSDRELDAFAGDAPPPCWLGGDNADHGLSYCRSCAEKAIAAGEGEYVDGGWGPEESDGCRHCETCGQVLTYSLTRHGVAYELEHFAQNPPQAPLDPETAFHIARIVESAPDNPEALALGQAAIALLRALDQEPQT